jgi:hypothetical protein
MFTITPPVSTRPASAGLVPDSLVPDSLVAESRGTYDASPTPEPIRVPHPVTHRAWVREHEADPSAVTDRTTPTGHRSPADRTSPTGRTSATARSSPTEALAASGRRIMAAGRDDADELADAHPVLDEIPELAWVLDDLRTADRALASAVALVATLRRTDAARLLTGVGLTGWLTLIARRTSTDARMLLTAADQLERSPSLASAFRRGAVSWAQVRSVVLAIRELPRHLDDRIDRAIAEVLHGTVGVEPDAITRVLRWELAALDPTPATDAQVPEREPFVAMQPRLDGSGGQLFADLDPVTWALADAALNRGAPPQERTRDGVIGDPDEPAIARNGRLMGAHRLERLREVFDAHLARSGSPGPATHGDGGDNDRTRPTLLLRAGLDQLLDRCRTPAQLLTTMLGGHVQVSADTARRLIDERGADLRTVVLDETGSVVGVGRRTRVPPGWLRDAVLALHDTCSAPGCRAPARTADLDHARPWHPHRDGDPVGRTDIDELAPLCRRDNAAKERDGWRVMQAADGSRRWAHQRSGIATRTLPATWRPPP